MDVIGCISACLHLAEVIAKQVDKFVSAPKQVQHIASDAALIGRVLHQLRDHFEPEHHNKRRVALSVEAVKLTFECIERCESVFTDIRRLLTLIVGKDSWVSPGATLSVRQKATYMRHDKSLREQKEELKSAKQNLVLINSINQLALSLRGSAIHDGNRGALDEMKVMLQLIYDNQHHGAVSAGQASETETEPPISTSQVHGSQGPQRGLGTQATQTNTVEPPINTTFNALLWSNTILRVHRNAVPMEWLHKFDIRWINDPYDRDMINVHSKLSPSQFQHIVTRAQLYEERLNLVTKGRDYNHGKARTEIEEVERLEEKITMEKIEKENRSGYKKSSDDLLSHKASEEMRLAEKARLAEERKRQERKELEELRKESEERRQADEDLLRSRLQYEREREEARRGARKNASRPDLFDYDDESTEYDEEDYIDKLASEWTTAEDEERPRAPGDNNHTTNACDVKFTKGQTIWQCGTCVFDEEVDFCAACFKAADHEGHKISKRKADTDTRFCDCGLPHLVIRDIACGIHGTMRP